jgi:hypothetical protein
MSTDLIRIHDFPIEAKRLEDETLRLVQEFETRGRTTALVLRAKDLRRRRKAFLTAIERVLAFDAAASIAYKERTGNELAAGEEYTRADAERAAKIVTAMESKTTRQC